MTPSLVNAASLAVVNLLLAAGQLLFKQVGLSIRGQPVTGVPVALLSSMAFYLAIGIYAGATLLWIWLLSRVPLTRAYPWSALAVAIVPLMAIILYGETVRPLFWVGITLIAAGIVVTQYGSV